jgi:hypothetical protein
MGGELRGDENFLTGDGRDTSALRQGRIPSEQIETKEENPVFHRVSCLYISSISLRQSICFIYLRHSLRTHASSLFGEEG